MELVQDLNILADQLGKDAVSRVHRLELENKHLKQVRSGIYTIKVSTK